MKKTISFFAVLIFSALHVCAQIGMTDAERKAAVKHLKESQAYMLKTIEGLSDEQLNYKPDAESWSIAECAKHITLSEQNIWAGFITAGLATEADASKRSEVQMSDEMLVGIIESREQKVKTFAPFEPENKPEALTLVLKEFENLRAGHLAYVEESKDDLRNRYATLPFGTIDLYQAILFMSGHTKRHTDQMKEVMASPNFPK